MSECSIHVGDVGAKIYVDIVDCDGASKDVSGATVHLFLTKPKTCEVIPDLLMAFSTQGATADRPTPATGDGTDGRMEYATVASQINVDGTWIGQPRITEGATVLWGEEFKFVVKSTAIS